MRIGILCEGGQTDGPVLDLLLSSEFPHVSFSILPTNKAAIFSAAGTLVDRLFKQHCERVIVLWDLHPIGAQMSVKSQTMTDEPCQQDQRKTLLERARGTAQLCKDDVMWLLRRYGFDGAVADDAGSQKRVALVCFSESFDAIFLSDADLLQTIASSDLRDAEPLPRVSHPEKARRPQEILRKYFRRGHNKRLRNFNKFEHNLLIARSYIENDKLARLRHHPGYDRLVTLIEKWVGV